MSNGFIKQSLDDSTSLSSNTNAPIWSFSIEIHGKFLPGRLLLSRFLCYMLYGIIVHGIMCYCLMSLGTVQLPLIHNDHVIPSVASLGNTHCSLPGQCCPLVEQIPQHHMTHRGLHCSQLWSCSSQLHIYHMIPLYWVTQTIQHHTL